MKKQLLVTLLLVSAIVAVGMLEISFLKNNLDDMESVLLVAQQQAFDQSVTVESFEKVTQKWEQVRENLELFINHLELNEIDFRLSESKSYVQTKQFEPLHAQMTVVLDLCHHLKHTCLPTIEHVL